MTVMIQFLGVDVPSERSGRSHVTKKFEGDKVPAWAKLSVYGEDSEAR